VIQEMLLTTTSERQGRAIDKDAGGEHGEEEEGGLFLEPLGSISDAPDQVRPRPATELRSRLSPDVRTLYVTDALIAEDIDAYLAQHQRQVAAALHHLRLGGRRQVDPDRAAALRQQDDLRGSARGARSGQQAVGTQGQKIDFALLVDGLAAEREQGITIDVAYRFFSTEKRKFIVADTPGHEQYTRNMVTGASTADLAVILIDARKGVLTQTRRHSYLAHLIGIKNIVLAVNKMDLVGYDQAVFDAHRRWTTAPSRPRSASPSFTAIPISGFRRQYHDSVRATRPGTAGPTLIEHLETVEIAPTPRAGRSACRCNGSTAPTSISAALPA
jgi:bifunctional enzyme CysN/CysC